MRKLWILIICLLLGAFQDLQATFDVKELTTSTGIRVRLRQDTSTPVISFVVSIQCGSARDKSGLEGTATLLASMMSEGTQAKSVEEYASFLQDRAISLSHQAGTEYFTLSLTTLRKYREDAFSILKESFWTPSFSEEAFERAKKEILTLIAMKASDPGYQVSLQMQKLIYKDHPYAYPNMGTLESVKAIQIADLKAFHKQFAKKDVLVAVSGNISQEEVEAYVNDLFADMPEDTGLEAIPDLDTSVEAVQFTIKQDIPQTVIGFAQKGLKYDDQRFLTYTLLAKILTERLKKDVRETNGLAYYIFAQPTANKVVGLLQGVSATKNQTVQKTLQMIRDIFEEIKKKGITEDEFSKMKAYTMGTFVLNFDDTPGITSALLSLMQIDRSPDYINIRNSLVEKISKEEVETMAREILDPDNMIFVLYGSPEGVS